VCRKEPKSEKKLKEKKYEQSNSPKTGLRGHRPTPSTSVKGEGKEKKPRKPLHGESGRGEKDESWRGRPKRCPIKKGERTPKRKPIRPLSMVLEGGGAEKIKRLKLADPAIAQEREQCERREEKKWGAIWLSGRKINLQIWNNRHKWGSGPSKRRDYSEEVDGNGVPEDWGREREEG